MSKKEGEIIFPIKPAGPPKVWKIIETKRKDTGAPIKFSIQEIPEDRYEDVIDHMCKYFIADEPMSDFLGKSFFSFSSEDEDIFNRSIILDKTKKLHDGDIKNRPRMCIYVTLLLLHAT